MLPVMAHSQQTKNDSGKVIVKDVQLETIIEDAIEPPPPQLTSRFETLQEWLLTICENDKPKKPITEFKFGLFESPNDLVLVLVGVNTYNEGKNRTVTRIEFEPSNMYFKLPENEYKHLNRDQLINKLMSQLKDFANTENFKSSFFTKANIVVFEINGQTIWSK
jgi:hypothetical protein